MCAINDPLGQTHSDHYSRFKVVYLCEMWKNGGNGRTEGRTYGQHA